MFPDNVQIFGSRKQLCLWLQASKICHARFLTVTLVFQTKVPAKSCDTIYSTKYVSNDLNLNGILYYICLNV